MIECPCGKTHTEAEWLELSYVGEQPACDGEGTVLELRNCSCGSTISAEVNPGRTLVAAEKAKTAAAEPLRGGEALPAPRAQAARERMRSISYKWRRGGPKDDRGR